jgi:hypothetical protein
MFGHVHGKQDKIHQEKLANEDKAFYNQTIKGIDRENPYSDEKLLEIYGYRNKQIAAAIFVQCFLAKLTHGRAVCEYLGINLKDEIFNALKKTEKTDKTTYHILKQIFTINSSNHPTQLMGIIFWQPRPLRGGLPCDAKKGLLKKVAIEIETRRIAIYGVNTSEEFQSTSAALAALGLTQRDPDDTTRISTFDGIVEPEYGVPERFVASPYNFPGLDNRFVYITREDLLKRDEQKRKAAEDARVAAKLPIQSITPNPALQNGNGHKVTPPAPKGITPNGTTQNGGDSTSDFISAYHHNKYIGDEHVEPLLGRSVKVTERTLASYQKVALQFIGNMTSKKPEKTSERELTTYHPPQLKSF